MYLKIIVFLSLVVSVPQLYIIPGGTDVPLAFILSLLLLPYFISNIRFFIRKKLFVISSLIIATQVVSLLWSVEVSGGVRDISYMVSFWFLISGVYTLHHRNPDSLLLILKLFLVLVCLESITIIIFRLLPDLKLASIFSPASKILLGQNVLNSVVLEGARNNFYDPGKSGGALFINANIAASYVGISSFLAYGLARAKRSFFLYLIAFLLWVSVFFTGSKASAIFAIIIPLVAYLLNSSRYKQIGILTTSLIVLLTFSLFLSVFNTNINNPFLTSAADTTETRIQIWDYGINSFLDSPVLGQGYGGWMAGFAKISNELFPPHNTIIYMWSKSGIFSAIFGVFFIYSTLKLAIKSFRIEDEDVKKSGIILLMISSWLFAHGMGENFGLIGDPHQMVLLVIALAISYSTLKFHDEKYSKVQTILNEGL